MSWGWMEGLTISLYNSVVCEYFTGRWNSGFTFTQSFYHKAWHRVNFSPAIMSDDDTQLAQLKDKYQSLVISPDHSIIAILLVVFCWCYSVTVILMLFSLFFIFCVCVFHQMRHLVFYSNNFIQGVLPAIWSRSSFLLSDNNACYF